MPGYSSDEYRRGARHLGLRWCGNDKRKPGKNLSSSQKKRNRKQSSIRARVERFFWVIKQQFGVTVAWSKTHHRSLADGAGKSLYAQAAADGCLRATCVCRFPKTADEEEKSGKTVKNVIYCGNKVMRFAKKTACLAIVAGTRFVLRFLKKIHVVPAWNCRNL